MYFRIKDLYYICTTKVKNMSTAILTITLAMIKNVKKEEIKNLDTQVGTFEMGKGIYTYELTKSGNLVKAGSVKFLTSISSFQNCSY